MIISIAHSLRNRFGSEDWCMYRGLRLINFADNHDVTRLASVLTDKNHLIPAYGLLFSMPGIPCVYYGSEWGIEGRKEDGDWNLRPFVDAPMENELTAFIAKAADAYRTNRSLSMGTFEVLHLTNRQFVFERRFENERIIVMVNADGCEYTAHFNANAGCGTELLSGTHYDFGGGSVLPPYSVQYVKVA